MKDQAIEHIRLGRERGFKQILDYFYPYPFLEKCYFFDSLRSDRRFKEILEEEKEIYLDKLNMYSGL
jgi:hypothetical protein